MHRIGIFSSLRKRNVFIAPLLLIRRMRRITELYDIQGSQALTRIITPSGVKYSRLRRKRLEPQLHLIAKWHSLPIHAAMPQIRYIEVSVLALRGETP